jgi:hypothetical protein
MTISLLVIVMFHHYHPSRLCLDRPVSPSSDNLFDGFPRSSQVVFVHSPYNSALFLPSCCCPFLLHVVANLFCIFLVSRQLVMLFQNSFVPFWGKKGVPSVLPKKFNLNWCQLFFPFRVQISLSYKSGDSQCITYFYSWKFLDQSWFKIFFYNSQCLRKFY